MKFPQTDEPRFKLGHSCFVVYKGYERVGAAEDKEDWQYAEGTVVDCSAWFREGTTLVAYTIEFDNGEWLDCNKHEVASTEEEAKVVMQKLKAEYEAIEQKMQNEKEVDKDG